MEIFMCTKFLMKNVKWINLIRKSNGQEIAIRFTEDIFTIPFTITIIFF